MQSYDYTHRDGVYEVSWDDFFTLAQQLAEALAKYQVEAIIGVARAGLFPATAVACMLRCELYPVRITRRLNDEVVYKTPVWKTPVPPGVAGKGVAIIDEISDTGETLAMVSDGVQKAGARAVVTACLASHSWANPRPELSAIVSDALVLFPWDQVVLQNGKWVKHPEIVAAMNAQVNQGK
jgi:hypoxanthine phosphoribosyltransferase